MFSFGARAPQFGRDNHYLYLLLIYFIRYFASMFTFNFIIFYSGRYNTGCLLIVCISTVIGVYFLMLSGLATPWDGEMMSSFNSMMKSVKKICMKKSTWRSIYIQNSVFDMHYVLFVKIRTEGFEYHGQIKSWRMRELKIKHNCF